MAGRIYEIMTKATIAKGHKKTIYKSELTVDSIDKILGCWITNHHYQASLCNHVPMIQGYYDIHVWYAYQNDSFLLKKQIQYEDEMNLTIREHRQMCESDELIVHCNHEPKCTKAKLDDHKMIIDIEKEMSLKIVGETTILVENKEELMDSHDEDLNINPDFIT